MKGNFQSQSVSGLPKSVDTGSSMSGRSHIQNNCVTQIGFDVEKEDTSSIEMKMSWIQEDLGKNDQNQLHEILKELLKWVGMWSSKPVG